jgi:hypothetical protein
VLRCGRLADARARQSELNRLKDQYKVLYWFTIVLGLLLYWLEV